MHFPVSILKYLRTPFSQSTSGRLFLYYTILIAINLNIESEYGETHQKKVTFATLFTQWQECMEEYQIFRRSRPGVFCRKTVLRKAFTKLPCLQLFLRTLTGKKHRQIKPQRLKKVQILAFGSLVHQILKQKNRVVTDKTPFFVIGPFCSHHSICLNIGFW